MMTIYGKALLTGLGLAAVAFVSAVPASAQYYERGYDRSGRYDRGYDQRYDRGYGRGYERQRNNLEAQKRAIRAQRDAQQRAVRGGGYGRGGYAGPNPYGPGGGVAIVPGPRGGYAVPTGPTNQGNN